MTTRPNVILIIADQLRRQALGCYGDPNVATPHIDALAGQGTRFDAASSSYPVCVPFRFSLVTGEHAHTRFIPSIEWRMSPAERTIADEFNEAGYHTALFGKWHLYGNFGHYPGHNVVKASRTPVPRPFQGRFQRFAGFDICNDPWDTYYWNEDDPTPHKIEGFQTDGLFDLAIEYADERARDGQPYATVLSVEPPHPIFTAPEEYLQRWADRPVQVRDNVELAKEYNKRGPHGKDLLDDLRTYYAMIENLDDNVGRLVEALRANGQLDNTVIALTADHGELLGCHGLLAKQRPWEESIGIPLIVSGGGVATARTVDDPVCTEDLFPTLLGLAGITPRDPKPGLDLTPLVNGTTEHLDREAVLLEFVAEMRPGLPFHDETWRGVRSRRYKYTVLGDAHGGKPWQFFDLETDPYELTNLVDAPEHAEQAAHHHGLLRDLLANTHDHYVLAPAFGQDGLNEWDPEAKFQRRFG
ncbi:choline-sulfatase [Catellatospora methionotrophica]|uniref:Choline-sulfatase n=1 Tax=Catellatospora methionotrophica TaxID=121620 RepID=A0A8J3LI53_9ACTN|nr:sulfatase [Catellatospora methionotrophica]GIG14920.1 choline-sulfatase [Catellatospora methionotrophica]